jgi:sulfoxide reductase heme-binding subunit YedZ
MSSPSVLWYTTRGLGIVLWILTTAVVVLGVATSRRWKAEGWPGFVVAGLHRNLSLLALALLPLHGLTVILDSYARLGIKDITVPFASSYRPLWLGLGVLGGELLIAVVLVSLVRSYLGFQLWKLTHWAAYAAWPLSLLHGLGTGSDTKAGWALFVYTASVGAVLLMVLLRLSLGDPQLSGLRVTAAALVIVAFVALAIWTFSGPLQPGWAAAAGTPRDLISGLRAGR